jgi:hypothetical protein
MISVILLIILIASFIVIPVNANPDSNEKFGDKDYYLKSQYAGNLGLFSGGIGKDLLNHKISLDFLYGYLPKSLNGVQVHTIAIKPAYHFKKYTISKIKADCYIGAAVNYNLTHNTYLKFPNCIPKGYYVQNVIHINPLIGTRISFPFKNRRLDNLSIFTELGTVDYKIWYALKNRNIGLDEIWNICFGSILYIRKN